MMVLLIAACSNDKKTTTGREKVQTLDETPDSALLVKLNNIKGDSMQVSIINSTAEKSYAFETAQQEGQIIGTLTIGDTLSIFPENKTQSVKLSINVSELRGRWFYNMQQHRGIRFEKEGALSSINPEKISFRQWKLLNGKLFIYYVDMQQTTKDRYDYQVEEAQIRHLDKDKLDMEFHGDIYKCQRERELIMF